jgi:septal ring factor EnvC (AmiA/AmiB activator)
MSPKKWIAAVALLTLCVPATAAARLLQDESKQESTNKDTAKAEPWQQEFDQVCGKTQDAMSLTVEELKALVGRCDALEPKIEKLDETRRKVYQRRLKQCRGLYAYVLESKSVDAKSNDKK